MIGKTEKLIGKWTQYATCFIVCLLGFASASVVKPIQQHHPMLNNSMEFSVLHFHVDDNEFTFEFNRTKNNKLIWTVKKTSYAFFPGDFVDDTEKNVGIGGNTSFCLPGIQEVVHCARYEFSVKEDLQSLFDAYPNSERHVVIDNHNEDRKWSALEYTKEDLEEYRPNYEKTVTIARLIEFMSASELERTNVRILILVHGDFHSHVGGIGSPKFKSNKRSKSIPPEEKIKKLIQKYPLILSSSEELFTNLNYTTRSQPGVRELLKSYRGNLD